MAGEPALDKILSGLRATLVTSEAFDKTLIEIDRPDDQPYGNAELPAINVVHRGTAFTMHEHGYQLHNASIDLEMAVSVDATATIGRRLRDMEADIVAALWADRTLGGIAQDVRIVSSGGDEDVRADDGVRPLSIEILFLTPIGDHRTILGASGLVP